MPRRLSADEIKNIDLDSLDEETLRGLADDLRKKAEALAGKASGGGPIIPLDCTVVQCVAGAEVL